MIFLCGLMLSAEVVASGEPVFELRGTIRLAPGLVSDTSNPIVQISSVNGGLQKSSLADAKGRFRIKKVPAGMYLFTAWIPRIARAKKTIEIGPSFADQKGRVEASLWLATRAHRPDRFQVPVGQLGIPTQAQREYQKGIERLAKRDRAGASAEFAKALASAPGFAAAHYQLGILATQEERHADAAKHFREALSQMPANYLYVLNLGRSLLFLRDGLQAVLINEAAVQSRPDDCQAQAQLAFSYMLMGRMDDAERHLKETILLDPANYLYPQLALAEIYGKRKDVEAAAQQLQEFLRLHPDAVLAPEVARHLSELRSRQSNPLKSQPPD